jgi:hypothetical protein
MGRPLLAALALVAALAAACRDASRPREPARAAAASADAPAAATPAIDLAAWTRMDPAAFGCWLERAVGRSDARWTCASAPYPERVDPCDERFGDGPAFPPGAAARLHPRLRDVALSWEGGALQAATFTFAPGVGPAEMARILGADGPALAAAASAGRGACALPCYVVTFFEPSDTACGDDDEEGDGVEPGP